MVYADFEYYRDFYLGIKITDSKTFKRLAREASAFLDAITFGNIDKSLPIQEPVKNAICAISEIKHDYLDGTRGISSESVGRVSISYSGASEKTEYSECYDMAYNYLINTGLLYRGVK
ncbi:MAG: hypothetical protein RR335_06940 [Eubacterium sp.]